MARTRSGGRKRAWVVARDSSGVEVARVELVPRRPVMAQEAKPVLVAAEDFYVPEGSVVTIEHRSPDGTPLVVGG